jgi:hypothetical protein
LSRAILDVCLRLKLLTNESHEKGKAMLERIAAMLVKLAKSLEER